MGCSMSKPRESKRSKPASAEPEQHDLRPDDYFLRTGAFRPYDKTPKTSRSHEGRHTTPAYSGPAPRPYKEVERERERQERKKSREREIQERKESRERKIRERKKSRERKIREREKSRERKRKEKLPWGWDWGSYLVHPDRKRSRARRFRRSSKKLPPMPGPYERGARWERSPPPANSTRGPEIRKMDVPEKHHRSPSPTRVIPHVEHHVARFARLLLCIFYPNEPYYPELYDESYFPDVQVQNRTRHRTRWEHTGRKFVYQNK